MLDKREEYEAEYTDCYQCHIGNHGDCVLTSCPAAVCDCADGGHNPVKAKNLYVERRLTEDKR